MVPFTRVPFWVPIFDPQPCIAKGGRQKNDASCHLNCNGFGGLATDVCRERGLPPPFDVVKQKAQMTPRKHVGRYVDIVCETALVTVSNEQRRTC